MIINIIGLACLSYLFAQGAQPIQDLKRLFNLDTDAVYTNTVQWFFVQLLNCSLCSGFWIGLLTTQSLILAGIVSILSEMIATKINK